ncbi:MAG: hypothetical protein A2252_06830 [Elusimicrobia bacterium RIFOXYA2_FULL_39_19]|nr:MAG: hypothetical protein A2252_06830 [Elusimicrobia bacterium RIFOXYA2_FULL_39_19]
MIRMKPHHFVDIITDFGEGSLSFEPHPYGHANYTVSKEILANPDVMLEMELGADDICKPCRHNINGLCDNIIDISFRPTAPLSEREYNLLLDQRWCNRLNIKQGDRLTAKEFCALLNNLTGDIMDIYIETPAEMTREREKYLKKGIKKFVKL